MPLPEGLQLTPFDPTFFEDPYAVYKTLRTGDPCHQETTSFYPGDTWTVTSFELVEQLLKDQRLSANPNKIGLPRDPRANNSVTNRKPDMMTLDGTDHHRLRRAVQKAFTPTSVEQFRYRISETFAECVKDLPSRFDLVATIAKPLPTIVIAEYIGVDSSAHIAFKQWTDDLSLQGYPMPTDEQWRTIVAADSNLRSHIRQVIEHRRRNLDNDLVSRLIQDNALTNTEVVDMCCLLIGAGNFTTTDLISNAILACLQHGTKSGDFGVVVDECLRFDSPSMVVRRFAIEDIQIEDTTIRSDSVVNLVIAAANHDPTVFDSPDQFIADRKSNSHLSFGRGVHHCLGAPLAKLEAAIVLEAFFDRFPSAQLVSFERDKRMSFRGCRSLVVEV